MNLGQRKAATAVPAMVDNGALVWRVCNLERERENVKYFSLPLPSSLYLSMGETVGLSQLFKIKTAHV